MTGTVQLPDEQQYRAVLGIVQEARDAVESLALCFEQDKPTGLATAADVRSLLRFTEGLLTNVRGMRAYAEMLVHEFAGVDIARLDLV